MTDNMCRHYPVSLTLPMTDNMYRHYPVSLTLPMTDNMYRHFVDMPSTDLQNIDVLRCCALVHVKRRWRKNAYEEKVGEIPIEQL